MGNAQIKWALIKKGLPLETTLFSVSYFSHACLANRTLIREAPGIFSHTRIRTQQDQLLRLNTYCCVRSINSINWHTCVHSVHCTPFKIVTATAFLSEKIQFCAVEAPESHLLRKSRLAPDNQSWFNRFWPPGFVITFPVIDSAVWREFLSGRSKIPPCLIHTSHLSGDLSWQCYLHLWCFFNLLTILILSSITSSKWLINYWFNNQQLVSLSTFPQSSWNLTFFPRIISGGERFKNQPRGARTNMGTIKFGQLLACYCVASFQFRRFWPKANRSILIQFHFLCLEWRWFIRHKITMLTQRL